MGMEERLSTTEAPLVTFVVPCYNAASFMGRAVDSLLAANHPCEVLLVNDGSTDDTSQLAHAYDEEYDFVRAVDQTNANWGGVMNHALELAQGTYFKVLDSDDYMDPQALCLVLDELARLRENGDAPDLLITNYVYDHLPSGTQRVMQYRRFFPEGRTFGWDEMRRPTVDEFIMIHACWYATALLRETGVQLQTGVSYMDSLLLLHPLPSVRKLCYLDVEPYYYVIGREGQSIDVEVVKRHIDEQLLASRLAIDEVDYAQLYETNPSCAELMAGYMLCMMSVSTLNLFLIGTPEAIAKNDELWRYLKEHNPVLYRKVRFSWVGLVNRKTKLGRFLALRCFAIAKRIYKLA